MEQEIKLSNEDWNKFYESQGSQFFRLESETLKAHVDDWKKLFFEILNSTTQLIQIIGVVAGFGFTGLSFVKNIYLFIYGEFLFFIAIFIGLLWIQKIYKSNFNSSDKEIKRLKSIFYDRYLVFKNIYDKALAQIEKGEEISISTTSKDNLLKKNNNLMEGFKLQEAEKKEWNPLGMLMFIFAVGGVSLLLSFLG